ncbi:hypothetical protein TcarDRAFT_1213 [Thermosinus carboxydivorans Nor1]|uniref:Uncharacterized protein n=1 Tax=Thermosinus carboxydivorans Nor1 TaxID=401526 RepID=A1HQJ1_9FIRM|nr:hypothetical protein TcarDRAFT_1213 [Thermosinus carboxydivorans Nor1]
MGEFQLAKKPYLTAGGRKLKTYLFAFIDDCSRIIPYTFCQISFPEKFDGILNLQIDKRQ